MTVRRERERAEIVRDGASPIKQLTVTTVTQEAHVCSYLGRTMNVFRGISSDTHGAIETIAAPAIMAAPLLLGFGQATAAVAVAFGALLFALAFSLFGANGRRTVPLSAHADLDYALATFVILAGLGAGLLTGDMLAAGFLVVVGIAHMALTASTRFSGARGAF